MNSKKTLQYLSFFVLFLSFFFVLTKPAWYLLKNDYSGKSSWKADFGIPTTWRKGPGDPVPPKIQLPDNSIGLDFLNVDTYMRCVGLSDQIYTTPCLGDPFGRPYTYPPLLTLVFIWIPLFSTAQAVGLWSLSVLIGILLSLYLIYQLVQKEFDTYQRWQSGVWILGLTLSYPSIFSFERGNSDVVILLLFALWIYFLKQKNFFAFGLIASLAFMTKIYPVVFILGCLSVLLFFGFEAIKKNKNFSSFSVSLLLGLVLGIFVPFLFMNKSYMHFFSETLPMLKSLKLTDAACVHCHSWPVAFGTLGYVAIAFCLGVGLLHCAYHIKKFTLDDDIQSFYSSLFSLSLICAIMVNIPNTSYDYSLVLTFPFVLIWLLVKDPRHQSIKTLGLILFLIGLLFPRWLHELPDVQSSVSPYVILQTAGLVLCGIHLLFGFRKR